MDVAGAVSERAGVWKREGGLWELCGLPFGGAGALVGVGDVGIAEEVIPDRSEWKLLRTNFGDMYVSPRRILEYDSVGRFVGVRCQVYCPHFMGPEGPKS